MKQKLLFITSILLLSFFTKAQTTITLQPGAAAGKDAQIIGATGSNTTNYGNNLEFMAFTGSLNSVATTTRALIQFDLSSIPANSVINLATLSLYAYNQPDVGNHTIGNNACYFRRITSSWDENTVTWNNQPGISGGYVVSMPNATSSTQNYDLNVINLVQEIVNGAVTNYGWMMQLQTEIATRAMVFASSDNSTASLRPKLVITYTTCASLPPASISASGSTTICSNSSVTLNASPIGAGLYSYQWYYGGAYITNALNTSYVATISGNYQCMVRTISTGCAKLSNTITVTTIPAPTATIIAGGPTTFCTGSNVVLTANAGTGYTWQWKLNGTNIASATLQNYTASATGTYTVTVTAGGCNATSNGISVNVNQPLTTTITDNGILGFCGSTTVQLETQSGTGYLYQWFEDSNPIPNSSLQQLQAGHDGTYSVRITNSCGTYPSAPLTITDFQFGWGGGPLNPYMYIDPSGSTSICSGSSVSLGVSFNTIFFNPSFQWYKDGVAIAGASGQSYTATLAGVYTCSVTDELLWWCGGGFGPTVFSNFITVTSSAGTYPAVSISAAGNTNFCSPGSVVLNSSVNTSVTYQWRLNGNSIGGATSPSYTASSSGTYTCAVTNSCGTVISNGIAVTAQTLSQTITSSTTNICTGSSVIISATQLANNTFQWKLNGSNIAGATASTYAATASGSYSCVVTNICGTTTTNSIVMTLRPKPTAAISGTQTICSGGTATLSIAFTGSPNWFGYYFNGSNYTNFNTASNPYTFNVILTSTKTYTLYSVFNDAYCSGTVSGSAVVTVASSTPVATITPAGSTTFCSGGSVQLNASTGSGYTYHWKNNGTNIPGATLSTYTATAAGNYSVRITNSCGSSTSPSVVVTVNSNPSAAITPNGSTTFCSGGSVTLNAPANPNRAYQWKKGGVDISGATSPSYIAAVGGTYKVTVTNTNTGCFSTTTNGTVVTVNALPAATITPQGPTTFCAGGSVTLIANSGSGLTYQWKKNGTNISGATNINYVAATAGTYKVKVTNANGCTKISGGTTVTVPCRENESVTEGVFDVRIHPNPSSGNFILTVENTSDEQINITVFDMVGRLIQPHIARSTNSEFLISNLSSGVYTTVISNGKNKRTLKLVKTE